MFIINKPVHRNIFKPVITEPSCPFSLPPPPPSPCHPPLPINETIKIMYHILTCRSSLEYTMSRRIPVNAATLKEKIKATHFDKFKVTAELV